jgi:hypothetical protein
LGCVVYCEGTGFVPVEDELGLVVG